LNNAAGGMVTRAGATAFLIRTRRSPATAPPSPSGRPACV